MNDFYHTNLLPQGLDILSSSASFNQPEQKHNIWKNEKKNTCKHGVYRTLITNLQSLLQSVLHV